MPIFLHIANFFPSRNAKEAQAKNSLKKACVEKVCMKKLQWRKVVWWRRSRNEGRKQRSKTGDETSFCSNFGAKTCSIPYYFHLFTFHTFYEFNPLFSQNWLFYWFIGSSCSFFSHGAIGIGSSCSSSHLGLLLFSSCYYFFSFSFYYSSSIVVLLLSLLLLFFSLLLLLFSHGVALFLWWNNWIS